VHQFEKTKEQAADSRKVKLTGEPGLYEFGKVLAVTRPFFDNPMKSVKVILTHQLVGFIMAVRVGFVARGKGNAKHCWE